MLLVIVLAIGIASPGAYRDWDADEPAVQEAERVVAPAREEDAPARPLSPPRQHSPAHSAAPEALQSADGDSGAHRAVSPVRRPADKAHAEGRHLTPAELSSHRPLQPSIEPEVIATRSGSGALSARSSRGAAHSVSEDALREFFKRAPKVELHTHLDGTGQPEFFCELAKKSAAEHMLRPDYLGKKQDEGGCRRLPMDKQPPASSANATCEESITPYVTSPHSRTLTEFLGPFPCIQAFLRLPGGLDALSIDFVRQQAEENVVYTEVNFAPQLLVTGCTPFKDCDPHNAHTNEEAVRITKEIIRHLASAPEVASDVVVVKVILDCVRGLSTEFCAEVLKMAYDIRDGGETFDAGGNPRHYSDFLVGIGLVSNEIMFPNNPGPGGHANYMDFFAQHADEMQRRQLGFAPHSGEPNPGTAANCESAIGPMKAARVGHGYYCTESSLTEIKQKGLHIEVCPSSSRATGAVPMSSWNVHPIKQMKQLGVSISLSTDDRGIIGTTMTEEHLLARMHLGFSIEDLARTAIDGIKASFAQHEIKASMCGGIRSWWMEVDRSSLGEIAEQSEISSLDSYLATLECLPAAGRE